MNVQAAQQNLADCKYIAVALTSHVTESSAVIGWLLSMR